MFVDDLTRLKHMRDATRQLIAFGRGRVQADLASDVLFARGVMKTIEIIGEAASRISKETQARHPEIPWQQIIGMRNRLIHVYFDINLDFVWEVAIVSAPGLIQDLERAVADLEQQT